MSLLIVKKSLIYITSMLKILKKKINATNVIENKKDDREGI